MAWVEEAVFHPRHEEMQADGRIRRWARISEAGERCRRVILLVDGETVHNAFLTGDSRRYDMRVSYFEDTDTLLVTFSDSPVADTTDLNENTLVDMDGWGRIVAITIEHAATQTDIRECSFAFPPVCSNTP